MHGGHAQHVDVSPLAEILTFHSDWLDGQDTDLLATSLRRFVDTTGYDLAELQPTSTTSDRPTSVIQVPTEAETDESQSRNMSRNRPAGVLDARLPMRTARGTQSLPR